MDMLPVVGIAAWSGVGKTTLIEALIPELRALGLRAAVIKHADHDLVLDGEGTDSRRCFDAGAEAVLACAGGTVLLTERRQRTLRELLAFVGDVDLVLVEGFKHEPIRRIGLYRPASGQGLTAPPGSFAALVTDVPGFRAEVPVFTFDQIPALARFLAARRADFLLPVRG